MRARFCSRSEKIPACAEFVQAGLIIRLFTQSSPYARPTPPAGTQYSFYVAAGGGAVTEAALVEAAFMEASLAVGSTVEDFTADFTDVPHLGGLSRLALTPFRLVDPDAFLSVNA